MNIQEIPHHLRRSNIDVLAWTICFSITSTWYPLENCSFIHLKLFIHIHVTIWGHQNKENLGNSVLKYICMSVCLTVCLSVWLSTCLIVCPSDCLSVCLSDCLSAWLSVCLSDCLKRSIKTSCTCCHSYFFSLLHVFQVFIQISLMIVKVSIVTMETKSVGNNLQGLQEERKVRKKNI